MSHAEHGGHATSSEGGKKGGGFLEKIGIKVPEIGAFGKEVLETFFYVGLLRKLFTKENITKFIEIGTSPANFFPAPFSGDSGGGGGGGGHHEAHAH